MNGLAERMVQTFKDGVANFTGEDTASKIQKKLEQFLFKYRITPHTTTGISPSEMMFGRKVRTIFDLLRPGESIADRVIQSQQKMKKNFNSSKPRTVTLKPDDSVRIRCYGRGPHWRKAIIKKQTGAVTYDCTFPNGTTVKRHLNQIWHDRGNSPESSSSAENSDSSYPYPSSVPVTLPSSSESSGQSDESFHDLSDSSDDSASTQHRPVSPLRTTRSGRAIRPPDKYSP